MSVLEISVDGRDVGSLDYSSLDRGDTKSGLFIASELQRLTGQENLNLCKTVNGDPMDLKDLEWFNEPTVTNKDGRELMFDSFFRCVAAKFEYHPAVETFCAVATGRGNPAKSLYWRTVR